MEISKIRLQTSPAGLLWKIVYALTSTVEKYTSARTNAGSELYVSTRFLQNVASAFQH